MKTAIPNKNIIICLLVYLFSTQVLAYNPHPFDTREAHPWSITASLGYGASAYMLNNDGQTALGRLAFGYKLVQVGSMTYGAELGVQNGNQMRFDIPQSTLDILGGEPIAGSLKPIPDALFTLSMPISSTFIDVLFKGGVVYRQLQIDRTEVNDLSEWNPELQAGFGYSISEALTLNLSYQYIFGANPNFTIDTLTDKASIAHIPPQNAVLLGLTFLF